MGRDQLTSIDIIYTDFSVLADTYGVRLILTRFKLTYYPDIFFKLSRHLLIIRFKQAKCQPKPEKQWAETCLECLNVMSG